jgi:hypothetical protein
MNPHKRGYHRFGSRRCLAAGVAACAFALLAISLPGTLWATEVESGPPDAAGAEPAAKAKEPTAIEKLKLRQQQIARDFQHLQDVLLRMAELSAATDPQRAALLRKAVQTSEEKLMRVQFQSLVELIDEGRLSRAIENQEVLLKDLGTLLELLLSEDRNRRLKSEKARIREYLKRISQIIKQQKDIQGRTTGGGDPKPLADQQGKVAGKTGRLAGDIKRNEEPAEGSGSQGDAGDRQQPSEGQRGDQGEGKPGKKEEPKSQGKGGEQEKSQRKSEGGQKSEGGEQSQSEGQEGAKSQGGQQGQQGQQGQGGAPGQQQQGSQSQSENENPARRQIEAAEARMREAQEKLEEAQREGAAEKQEEAIRALEQAKADLERILRQLREEEIERMLTMLEARFVKMLQMQRAVYEGTVKLDKVPEPDRTDDHRIEATRLSRKEAEIVLEADKALTLLRDDGTAVAFPEAVEQAREDMLQVAGLLDEAKVGQVTQTIEQEIIAALEEMIEAFKQAQQDAEKRRQQMPPMPSRPQDQPLVDLLAEIRMIRTLQVRVNRRTERYSKLVVGEQAGDPDLLDALRKLGEQERRIHQITRDLETGRNR